VEYTFYMIHGTRNYQLSRSNKFLFCATTTTTGRSVGNKSRADWAMPDEWIKMSPLRLSIGHPKLRCLAGSLDLCRTAWTRRWVSRTARHALTHGVCMTTRSVLNFRLAYRKVSALTQEAFCGERKYSTIPVGVKRDRWNFTFGVSYFVTWALH
jgi:hypothetical protein